MLPQHHSDTTDVVWVPSRRNLDQITIRFYRNGILCLRGASMAAKHVASQLPSWTALLEHYNTKGKSLVMRALFEQDPERQKKFSLVQDFGDGPLLFDYSKHIITEETLGLLFKLAHEADVAGGRDKMFTGAKINTTENRAVLHVALRNRSNTPILLDGQDVMPEVNRVLAHMKEFSEAIRSGSWLGFTGKVRWSSVLWGFPCCFCLLVICVDVHDKSACTTAPVLAHAHTVLPFQPISDVVNIGIGGSDLGPLMVTEALKPFAGHVKVPCASSMTSSLCRCTLFPTWMAPTWPRR